MTSAKAVLLGAALLALSGCASQSTTTPAGLANPQAARITDERMVAERQALEGLQSRLKALNDAGVPIKSYAHAKAQCWLDSAKTQYHENDRTGYIEEAMAQSLSLIKSLEADKTKPVAMTKPLIAQSDRLRPDLWKRFEALKGKPGFYCVEQLVACNEVRLVRAGHANQQTGWRQASPHIAMVDDALNIAEREEAACKRPTITTVPKEPVAPAAAPAAASAPAAVAPAATPVPAPVAAPARVISTERITILADALFDYDQYTTQHILPQGKSRMKEAAQSLKSYYRIDKIRVIGYTDRVGTDQYNQVLSQRRADTVKAYLKGLGVEAPVFTAEGMGKSLSMSPSCPRGTPLEKLAPCLQPDRKVELEVTGIVQ
jgi:outer membrane protein OmpA-like peptidoglycan-associated protein